MTRIAVIGLAKSGTTGLWSRLVNTYPRKYLRFFEGDFLQTRYNKYLGRQKPSKDAANIIDKQIIVPNFRIEALNDFDKVIWLVRDPRDRLVSYILYRHFDHRYQDDQFVLDQIQMLEEKEANPESVSLKTLESRLALPPPSLDSGFFWEDHKKWAVLESSIAKGIACVFKYEDFVKEHFEILETFLNVRIGKNKKVPKQFERVIRSRSSGFWQDWFTEEDLEYYGDLFDPFLRQFGYGTVITQRGSKQINPVHGSQYVKKIVNERRHREGLRII